MLRSTVISIIYSLLFNYKCGIMVLKIIPGPILMRRLVLLSFNIIANEQWPGDFIKLISILIIALKYLEYYK